MLIDRSATDPAEHAAREDAFASALRGLDERQRVTLALRFRHDMTFEEIGCVLGLSAWSVGQIFKAAIAMVKASGGYRALCPN